MKKKRDSRCVIVSAGDLADGKGNVVLNIFDQEDEQRETIINNSHVFCFVPKKGAQRNKGIPSPMPNSQARLNG